MVLDSIRQEGNPIERRRKIAKVILEYLKERENHWISVRDLASRLFSTKSGAITDAVAWLTRHEQVFTQTTMEGKRRIKLVRYSPPPPDQCKYCRGKGCLICNGEGKLVVTQSDKIDAATLSVPVTSDQNVGFFEGES